MQGENVSRLHVQNFFWHQASLYVATPCRSSIAKQANKVFPFILIVRRFILQKPSVSDVLVLFVINLFETRRQFFAHKFNVRRSSRMTKKKPFFVRFMTSVSEDLPELVPTGLLFSTTWRIHEPACPCLEHKSKHVLHVTSLRWKSDVLLVACHLHDTFFSTMWWGLPYPTRNCTFWLAGCNGLTRLFEAFWLCYTSGTWSQPGMCM